MFTYRYVKFKKIINHPFRPYSAQCTTYTILRTLFCAMSFLICFFIIFLCSGEVVPILKKWLNVILWYIGLQTDILRYCYVATYRHSMEDNITNIRIQTSPGIPIKAVSAIHIANRKTNIIYLLNPILVVKENIAIRCFILSRKIIPWSDYNSISREAKYRKVNIGILILSVWRQLASLGQINFW